MGKNKDKKKKGLGMEKTMAKTEKKMKKNLKKELDDEEDIESLIAQFNEKEKELNQTKEEILPAGKFPSRRGGATFNLVPERDEFVLFGGEYYNGQKVFLYNDLFIYSIKKGQWTQIKSPNAPPPRQFHQAVTTSRNNGELWIFGGEFSSPSQSQFYHYNDLWVFNFQTKQWSKIVAPNPPSSRSGHRMVILKKYLVVFGGFYDNLRNCRYFNDTYLFNLETNLWEEMKFAPNGLSEAPTQRSACQMVVCNKTNTIVVYGGFSKAKGKKEQEKGIVHTDMFTLSFEVKKNDKLEWSWKRVRQAGMKPTERISATMIPTGDDLGYMFGGVHDLEDDDENEESDDDENEDTAVEKVKSYFYSDLYKLDLVNHKWSLVNLKGTKEKKAKKEKKPKANKDASKGEEEEEESEDESEDEKMDTESLEKVNLNSENGGESEVFQLTYSKTAASPQKADEADSATAPKAPEKEIFVPHPRRSSYLQFHKGVLYMFGGKYEDNKEKEYVLNDMHYLNLKKLDEWKTVFDDNEFNAEVLTKLNQKDSSSESEAESENGSGDEEESDDEDENFEAPKAGQTESLEKYFGRTEDFWIDQAKEEFPTEKSKKKILKAACEFCSIYWKKVVKAQKPKEEATES